MSPICRAAILLVLAVPAWAEPKPDPEGGKFFSEKIQPILRENCFKCHSHSAEKIKGGLVLDSREALLNGGDNGPAIVPGEPGKSLIIDAVGYQDQDLQMPPKNKKLSDDQIALLTDWVKRGAPWDGSGVLKPSGQKMALRPKGGITAEDKQWWSFQPMGHPEVPPVAEVRWEPANEIDHFVHARLKQEGLEPAPRAERAALIRRLYFDLTGLPPSPDEVDDFVHDESPGAYEKVVDRLLESPRYGEHWGRHWLDLARYAESDGFKADDYRPEAWRYRDYVIKAFNEDKPYDRFVREQLAGDELYPGDLDALVATGFLRNGIYEYNNRDVALQWSNILNDLTDVTGDVFLGMGVQCARCHDHKFDPILQKDYYRLQAFFAPVLLRTDMRLSTPDQQAQYEAKLTVWKEKTADLREKIAAIEEPAKERAKEDAYKKFPPETQKILRKSAVERTPWEEQIFQLAFRQVEYEWDHLVNHMRGTEKDRIVALQKQLSAFDKEKPEAPPLVQCVSDIGPVASPVTIPKKANLGDIQPGILSVLDDKPAEIHSDLPYSTGRRAALARWLTDSTNPLAARVIVNRVWQYHFGRGLVGTSSDFGHLGDKPSHPELLDWLAQHFIADGWSLKKLHKLIVLSATYQQAATNPTATAQAAESEGGGRNPQLVDPENRLLWRANTKRLDAEEIRDAILSVTGELNLDPGGPSADFSKPRRSVYTKVLRNTKDAVLEAFDAPESFSSVSQRNVTTTPTQALLMMNGPWSLQRAKVLSTRLEKEGGSNDSWMVGEAYRLAFGRPASSGESEKALKFLDRQQYNIVLPKEKEQVAPFASDKIPFRDGRAAVITPGTTMDRLTVPNFTFSANGDFTAEAFIVLKTLYQDGEVRTIVSQWDGDRAHPGWTFGVTGMQSRYKPQTLVLQLRGDQAWTEKDAVEPIFSGLHIALGKPYFVAVSVKLADPSETGVTFYSKDLSNDDEPLQIATFAHKVTSGINAGVPLQIGARSAAATNLFDGLIDDVRLSDTPLAVEQLLLNNAAVSEHTIGYWKFENDPGVYRDSSPRAAHIQPRMIEPPRVNPGAAAFADFCHVLLNANEFLYTD